MYTLSLNSSLPGPIFMVAVPPIVGFFYKVYSISYGAPDYSSDWAGEEARLAQLAAIGITVIAASGMLYSCAENRV